MSLRAGRTSEWRRDSGLYPHRAEPYGAMRIEMEKIERQRKKWAAIFGKALNTGVKGAEAQRRKCLSKEFYATIWSWGKEMKKTGIWKFRNAMNCMDSN